MSQLTALGAALEGLWAAYGAAVVRRDPDGIAGLFTADGDMTAVDGTHVNGTEAIAAYYRRQFAGAFQNVSIQDVELASPRPLGADAAIMNATWMVLGLEPEPFRVRATFLARTDAGGWRLAAVRFAAARAPGAVAGQTPSGRLEALKRRYFDAYNRRDLSIVDEVVSPSYVLHAAGFGEIVGREALRSMLQAAFRCWPDGRLSPEEMVCAGDRLVTRWVFHGTHAGEFLGVPATGRQVTATGTIIDRFEADQIVEAWEHMDLVGLLRQLGRDVGAARGEGVPRK